MADHKKKRAYAAQAYEFGANAPPTGGAPAPAIPGMGMPASPQGDLAGQFGQMNIGAGQQPGPAPVGGYQPPQAGYQPPGYQQPGVQQQVQQVTPQAPTTAHLNQLFPSDLIQQPFNVLELDQAPPPIK
jgi:protein transport protein SEC24